MGRQRTPHVSNRLRQHPFIFSVSGLVLCAISGCAALSLFSQTHHHTHTYSTPELEQRLQALEVRTAEMESKLAALGVPSNEFVPVLPSPVH
jgi:hypothetical protein